MHNAECIISYAAESGGTAHAMLLKIKSYIPPGLDKVEGISPQSLRIGLTKLAALRA